MIEIKKKNANLEKLWESCIYILIRQENNGNDNIVYILLDLTTKY